MDRVYQGASAVSASAEPSRRAAWLTRPDVEFLNSLCPRSGTEFPQMDKFIGDHSRLAEACKVGFLAVSDLWYAKIPDAVDCLTQYEFKVWIAIHARTLKFGKLFEKIPERHFIDGIRNEEGSLKYGKNGLPILQPVNVNGRRNLDKAIRKLIVKVGHFRFESDRHHIYGTSHVYAPFDTWQMLDTFLTTARSKYVGANAGDELIGWEWISFQKVLGEKCARLFDELSDKDQAARHAIQTAAAISNEPGDGSRPPVRRRVRNSAKSAGA